MAKFKFGNVGMGGNRIAADIPVGGKNRLVWLAAFWADANFPAPPRNGAPDARDG